MEEWCRSGRSCSIGTNHRGRCAAIGNKREVWEAAFWCLNPQRHSGKSDKGPLEGGVSRILRAERVVYFDPSKIEVRKRIEARLRTDRRESGAGRVAVISKPRTCRRAEHQSYLLRVPVADMGGKPQEGCGGKLGRWTGPARQLSHACSVRITGPGLQAPVIGEAFPITGKYLFS